MLMKITIAVFCLISIPIVLVISAFIQNDLPWTDSPGFKTRLHHYLTTNVAETTDQSSYPELLIQEYHHPIDSFFLVVEESVNRLGWEIDSQGDQVHSDQAYSLHAVVTTPVRKYKDDVLIRLIPVPEDSFHLYIRSSSREGHGDLGTNTRHILDLYDQIEVQMAR